MAYVWWTEQIWTWTEMELKKSICQEFNKVKAHQIRKLKHLKDHSLNYKITITFTCESQNKEVALKSPRQIEMESY